MKYNKEKLNNRINKLQHEIKDFFIIDIDNLSKANLLLTYARILNYFIDDIQDIKEELQTNKLVRVFYSSSKKGYHIKVNIKNNVYENIYFRTIFNDDIYRVKLDIERLGGLKNYYYDVAFKIKMKNNKVNKKDFNLINVLEICNINKNTFYKLLDYIENNKLNKIDLILNEIKNIDYKKNKLNDFQINNLFRVLDAYELDKILGKNDKINLLNKLYKQFKYIISSKN